MLHEPGLFLSLDQKVAMQRVRSICQLSYINPSYPAGKSLFIYEFCSILVG